MKAGVPMRRRSNMEISSLIVFLSIISIIVQFVAYYFLASKYLILGISAVALIICTHILSEMSLNFESCFIYTILVLFISLIITLLTYLGADTLLPYTNTLIGIVALNWLVPTIYCIFRNMFDFGGRIENFLTFYRKVSIIFILFYIGILIYGSFAADAFPWVYRMKTDSYNFTPFWSIATQIEDYINHMIPLSDIITYLLSRILTYIPYGFYVILLLRNKSKLIRFISLLLLPSAIELFQYFIIPARCDIDDIVYAFIGGVIGALWFHLTNVIYRTISGRDFLAKDSDFRINTHTLYF